MTSYIELNPSNHIRSLYCKDGSFKINGIHLYPSAKLSTLAEIYRHNYDCQVIDFGLLSPYTASEFNSCQIKIVMCPTSTWKISEINEFKDKLLKYNVTQENVIFLGNKRIKEIQIKSFPFISNPFQITSEHLMFYEKLLNKENIS